MCLLRADTNPTSGNFGARHPQPQPRTWRLTTGIYVSPPPFITMCYAPRAQSGQIAVPLFWIPRTEGKISLDK